jgi:hypothetical protein
MFRLVIGDCLWVIGVCLVIVSWFLVLGFWLLFAYSGNINEYCNITPGGDGPVRVLAVANLQVG